MGGGGGGSPMHPHPPPTVVWRVSGVNHAGSLSVSSRSRSAAPSSTPASRPNNANLHPNAASAQQPQQQQYPDHHHHSPSPYTAAAAAGGGGGGEERRTTSNVYDSLEVKLQQERERVRKQQYEEQWRQQAALDKRIREMSMELEEDKLCVLCLDNTKEGAFLPCGHRCCCMECGERLVQMGQPCPVCRKHCPQFMRIYN